MDNLNTITYAEDWKEAYTPIYKENLPEPEREEAVFDNKPEKKHHGKPLLLIIQLILCLLIFVAAFCIKTFGGDFYTTVHNWYYENLNDEIIMTENFESFDLDSIFGNEN